MTLPPPVKWTPMGLSTVLSVQLFVLLAFPCGPELTWESAGQAEGWQALLPHVS